MTNRFLTFFLVAILFGPVSLYAQKGGGGGGGKKGGGDEEGPAPPGVIYFSGAVDGQVSTFELAPDGSAVQSVPYLDSLGDPSDPFTVLYPYGSGYPSTATYGEDNHRWWIYYRLIRTENPTPTSTRYFYDLFATADGVTEIRVTNFSDYDIMLGNNSRPPFWATGDDSFISFNGVDINLRLSSLYRIHVSAADLEAELDGTGPGIFPIVPTDTFRSELVYDAPTLYGANFRHVAWSPDGNQVVFTMDDGISEYREQLWRFDLVTSFLEPIYPDATSTPHVRWSPDGSKIALSDLGDILVMDPNVPGSEVVVVDGSIGIPYSQPLWAPDGSHLACLRQSYSKKHKQNEYRIYTVTLSDLNLREVGKNTDLLSYKRLLEWTPE